MKHKTDYTTLVDIVLNDIGSLRTKAFPAKVYLRAPIPINGGACDCYKPHTCTNSEKNCSNICQYKYQGHTCQYKFLDELNVCQYEPIRFIGGLMNKDIKIQVRLTKEQYRELKRLSSHTTMSTFIVSCCLPKGVHNASCQCSKCVA